MPWSAFADPGTKTTDAPQNASGHAGNRQTPSKRMTAEPRPMRFAQSDGQGPVGFFCICRRDARRGTRHGTNRKTADGVSRPGIMISTTNPVPGGTQ